MHIYFICRCLPSKYLSCHTKNLKVEKNLFSCLAIIKLLVKETVGSGLYKDIYQGRVSQRVLDLAKFWAKVRT